MNPSWNSDFHLNINLQMNYWPAEVTGLSALHEPLFDLMEALVPMGRHVAQQHYGAEGWVAHHLTDAWGFATPADGLHGIWPKGARGGIEVNMTWNQGRLERLELIAQEKQTCVIVYAGKRHVIELEQGVPYSKPLL